MNCAAVLLVADDTRITATQFRVFALIAKGYCKRADMAAKTGKSVVTIARAIDALVKLRLVEREIVKGKPSKLQVAPLIVNAASILSDTGRSIAGDTGTTRITKATRGAHDTTSRIADGASVVGDTGPAGDNSERACISTGARAHHQDNKNTARSDQIRSDCDQIAPATKEMVDALCRRAGAACNTAHADVHHGGELTRFLRAGCTWEDIEFATDKLAASFLGRGKTFSTWKLLEQHVIEVRDRRVAGLPPPAPPVAFQRAKPRRNGPYGANGIAPMVACG